MIVMFQNRKILAPTFLEYLWSNVPMVHLQKAAILQPITKQQDNQHNYVCIYSRAVDIYFPGKVKANLEWALPDSYSKATQLTLYVLNFSEVR